MPHFSPISLYDQQGKRKYLSSSERKKVYRAILELTNERKVLFLLLLYWTGVRISEALSVTADSVDHDEQVLIVKCLKKRDKIIYRRIPLPPTLLLRLKRLTKGEEQSFFPWSRRTAARYVKEIMNKCHITGSQACAKGLRHSFAVHCVTQNIPISLLSTWLGHSHISTTTIYLDIIGTEERELAQRIWRYDGSKGASSFGKSNCV